MQMIEMVALPEERSEVCGHRVAEFRQLRWISGLEQLAIVAELAKPQSPQPA